MHLRDIQCEADIAVDGESGLQWFQQGSYDLVVLDLMLPGMDGLAVCQKLRAGSDYVPILMLTAKASELDRVLGLELGADDYLTKPFSIPATGTNQSTVPPSGSVTAARYTCASA